MPKSRRHRSSRSGKRTMRATKYGLKKSVSTVKNIAKGTKGDFVKGLSAIYGTMSRGVNLGIKGAKSVSKDVGKLGKSRRRR